MGLGKSEKETVCTETMQLPANQDSLEHELCVLRKELVTLELNLDSKRQQVPLLQNAIAAPMNIPGIRHKGVILRTKSAKISTDCEVSISSQSTQYSDMKKPLRYTSSLGSTPSSDVGDPLELSTTSLSSELEKLRLGTHTPLSDRRSDVTSYDTLSVKSGRSNSSQKTKSDSLESLEDVLDKMASHHPVPELQRSWENLLEGITKSKETYRRSSSDQSPLNINNNIQEQHDITGNLAHVQDGCQPSSSNYQQSISLDSAAKIAVSMCDNFSILKV